MIRLLRFHGGNAGRLYSANPLLPDNTIGTDPDTGVMKVGDGISRWNELAQINGSGGSGGGASSAEIEWAARRQVPEARHRLFGKPNDSTPPTTLDTGQTVIFSNNGAGSGGDLIQLDDRLTIAGGATPMAGYATTTDGGLTRIGARFSFKPNAVDPEDDTFGGGICLSMLNSTTVNPADTDFRIGVHMTCSATFAELHKVSSASGTPAINTDMVDEFDILALATNITSMTTNLTGTPVNGQKLLIRFKDNGTARTITWGSSFQSSGAATLLATTVINKTHYVGLVYDSTAAKWVCMAVDSTGY